MTLDLTNPGTHIALATILIATAGLSFAAGTRDGTTPHQWIADTWWGLFAAACCATTLYIGWAVVHQL